MLLFLFVPRFAQEQDFRIRAAQFLDQHRQGIARNRAIIADSRIADEGIEREHVAVDHPAVRNRYGFLWRLHRPGQGVAFDRERERHIHIAGLRCPPASPGAGNVCRERGGGQGQGEEKGVEEMEHGNSFFCVRTIKLLLQHLNIIVIPAKAGSQNFYEPFILRQAQDERVPIIDTITQNNYSPEFRQFSSPLRTRREGGRHSPFSKK